MLIAFSGKRQFSHLFTPPLAKVEHYGRQTRLPPGWPRECLDGCEVWVLPSSSGRAAMTTEQRAVPYQQLAERFHQLPWPLEPTREIKHEVKTE
jgi:thymine-DNA glycosylase